MSYQKNVWHYDVWYYHKLRLLHMCVYIENCGTARMRFHTWMRDSGREVVLMCGDD